MKRKSLIRSIPLVALIAAGCGGQVNPLVPNQPPEVELFAQRVSGAATGQQTYQLQWGGRDPDGRVDHYLYATGPAGNDSRVAVWTVTTAREHSLSLAGRAASSEPITGAAIEPTVFSVRAVDARGAKSEPARLAFFDGALAPQVRITSPVPNPLIRYPISPDFCVEWAGTAFDEDTTATRVAEYKYIVLSSTTEVTVATARADPDSVRRYYAPRGWPDWTSRPGPITSAILNDLVMDQDYVFVITCFDRSGNYDPIFSFNKNMLYMRVVGAAHSLPVIGLYNESVRYYSAFAPQLVDPDTTRIVNLEVPAGQALTFNWFATAAPGRRITGYRWALDLANPDREGNHGPAGHWSPWDLATTSATVGPFNPTGASELHTLYIEARDDWGCAANDLSVARLVINLSVVRATFSRELLIVDDTRLLVDKVNSGTTCADPVNRPVGLWPTQAELDTFLYARGGVPWRCYPLGTISTPGIFSGYDFDTVGTRIGINDLTVRLSQLSRYRNVIWLVDAQAAHLSGPGSDPTDPQTSLRYMNQVGTENTLAAYARQGGRVWLAGAGTATASMINFNKTANDNRPPIPLTLTFSKTGGELGPGRFVYDQAHWRSEFKQIRVNNGRIRRYTGRFESSPGLYASLPVEIQVKTAATDPFPPNRVGQSPAVFYQTQFDVEFLSSPNEIIEDLDPGPTEDFDSTLDTLYKVTASSLQPDVGVVQSVAMTYYHGLDNTPFILTGYNLWNFRRSQVRGLVDFVLQSLWGMSPGPAAFAPASGARPVGAALQSRERPEAGAASVARRE